MTILTNIRIEEFKPIIYSPQIGGPEQGFMVNNKKLIVEYDKIPRFIGPLIIKNKINYKQKMVVHENITNQHYSYLTSIKILKNIELCKMTEFFLSNLIQQDCQFEKIPKITKVVYLIKSSKYGDILIDIDEYQQLQKFDIFLREHNADSEFSYGKFLTYEDTEPNFFIFPDKNTSPSFFTFPNELSW